jgi:hypothetical protein
MKKRKTVNISVIYNVEDKSMGLFIRNVELELKWLLED